MLKNRGLLNTMGKMSTVYQRSNPKDIKPVSSGKLIGIVVAVANWIKRVLLIYVFRNKVTLAWILIVDSVIAYCSRSTIRICRIF